MNEKQISLNAFIKLVSNFTNFHFKEEWLGAKATTVSLKPKLRYFYENLSKELDMSLQDLVLFALKGVMVVSKESYKTEVDTVLERLWD